MQLVLWCRCLGCVGGLCGQPVVCVCVCVFLDMRCRGVALLLLWSLCLCCVSSSVAAPWGTEADMDTDTDTDTDIQQQYQGAETLTQMGAEFLYLPQEEGVDAEEYAVDPEAEEALWEEEEQEEEEEEEEMVFAELFFHISRAKKPCRGVCHAVADGFWKRRMCVKQCVRFRKVYCEEECKGKRDGGSCEENCLHDGVYRACAVWMAGECRGRCHGDTGEGVTVLFCFFFFPLC